MSQAATRALLEEACRRQLVRRTQASTLEESRDKVLGTRFDKQLSLIESKARRRAGFCPRRSGKTETNVGLLLDGVLSGPRHLVIFVAKTRQRARDLTWQAVFDACEQFGIESKPNETLLSRSFPNGSVIRWTGADDIDELRKKRGDKLWRVIIDEAQDFDFHILLALVRDIFGPALEDLGGDTILTGTPGEVCAGYWYGVTGQDPDPLKKIPGWEVHRWTPLDNPHVPRIHERFRSGELAKEYGGEDSPTFQREWLGKWVRDTGALFYRFSPDLNLHDFPEAHFEGHEWQHVLGWDLGSNDDMAIVDWAFRAKERVLYEAFSWKKPGALSSEVANVIRGVRARFNVIAQVADTGGGGKMFVEEVRKRFQLDFDPAQKTEKAQHVRLLNDDLQRGVVKLRRGSSYAEEIAVLPKVLDWDEEKTGKPAPEDPRFPNHNSDAGLYSWRRAFNYFHEEEKVGPARGSPEAYAEEEREMEEEREERVSSRRSESWWEGGQ